MGLATGKESGGNDGEVESQPQASHLPLEIATRDSHISTAPATTSSSSLLISVDRCRPLHPLSLRQRRFAPNETRLQLGIVTGFI
jgi:hypothetical protein